MASVKLCLFCNEEGDPDVVGETFVKDCMVVHQYCLYFSSGLAQKSDQTDGICGFRFQDIHKELRRGNSIKCCGCLKPGGYVGCAVKACRKAGHFPCLHRLGFTFCYEGKFEAYCPRHCPIQPKLSRTTDSEEATECCICLTPLQSQHTIYCPCCLTTFHKTCIQKQALNAGLYYLRCPVCKDKDTYCNEMLRMGIAIPERDAQWEVGTDYVSEEPKYCYAEFCFCLQGRSHYTQIGKYRMRKCGTCGQCRGHVDCLRGDVSNECKDCTISVHSNVQVLQSNQDRTVRTDRTVGATMGFTKVPVLSIKKLSLKDIALIKKSSS